MLEICRTAFAWIIAAILVVIGMTAPNAHAQTTTYQYTGPRFTICGFGCPGSGTSQVDNAPADWAEDFVIVTLTFDAPLAPNLTFSDDVLSLLRGWTVRDAKGYFSLSSAAGDVLRAYPEEGIPIPLQLSTDGNGNIVTYVFGTTPLDGTLGTSIGLFGPPLPCPECGSGIFLAEFVEVYRGNDDISWNMLSLVPGQWKKLQTTTYTYTGHPFTFCGWGCPEGGTTEVDNAPADWAEDYIIATITFDAPLAPNLTFSDDVLSLLRGFTLRDAKGYFSYSSAAGDVLRSSDEGLPIPLLISTDSSGNIMDYQMGTGIVPGTVGTEVFIIHPPFQCPDECGPGIASGAAVNFGNDDIEWDVFTEVPGTWVKQGGTLSSTLTASPTSLSFTATVGAPAARRTVQIGSSGGSISWNATVEMLNGSGWITVSPASGTTSSVQPSTLTVEVNFGALGTADLYQAVITVRDAAGGAAVTIPVTAVFSSGQSRIGLSDSSIHLTIAGGGAAPPAQALRIFNRGGGTLAWSIPNIQFFPASANNWLNLSASSGTAGNTAATASQVNVSLNAANAQTLASGVYQALVPITSNGASNDPQLLTVTLQRVPGSTPPTPSMLPGGLFFVASQGGAAPATKSFTVSNQGGGELTAQFNASTASGGNWLGTSRTGVTITASSGPLGTQVRVDPTGLLRGVYYGTIRASFTTGHSLDVEVVLIVTPPAAGTQRLGDLPSPQLAGCTPTSVEVIGNTVGNGTIAPVSFPRVLRVILVDSCGEFVDNASVVASTEGTAIPLQGLGNGTYTGTWVPQETGRIPVTFTALHPTLPRATRSFLVSAGTAAEGIQLPVLKPDGVVEGAGFTPQRPLAPGGFISLFGSRFTDRSAGATQIPLERELAGVRVKVGNIDAPLHFVSPGQINAQMPLEAQPGASVSIVVSANGALTAPQTYLVAPAMPGIFVGGSGAAVLDGQSRPVTAANPARSGDILQIFATGLGETNPRVTSGAAGPASSTVTRPVTVTLGGVNAPVEYQGLAPGFVALYQVNIRVPGGVTPGDAVPLVIIQNGVTGNLALPAAIPVRAQ